MFLPDPIEIDLLTFVATGKFDYIKLGQTKEWILQNFPDPDDSYSDKYESPIWFYGDIEFHFDKKDALFLIYSDHLDTLSGGQSLRLHKWIFDRPEALTISFVAEHLARQGIGYTLKYRSLSDGYTSAAIEILQSGVALGFALPERDEEEYAPYLDRVKHADSNLFLLTSISLLAK